MIAFDVEQTDGQAGGSALLDRILRRLRDTLGSLKRVVTNDRLIAVTFAVATTDVVVRHGLGAPVLSWEVVDRDSDVTVWRSATVNANPRGQLILQASAAPAFVLIRVM